VTVPVQLQRESEYHQFRIRLLGKTKVASKKVLAAQKSLPAANAEEAMVTKDHIIVHSAVGKRLKSQVSRRRLSGQQGPI